LQPAIYAGAGSVALGALAALGISERAAASYRSRRL
jgi:hypothetical protein